MNEQIFCKEHAARLTALADRLNSDADLSIGKFNFRHVRSKCGTAGCAIGEAAHMWPDHLSIKKSPTHYWVGFDEVGPFFGIEWDEYLHLFLPDGQKPYEYGGKFLRQSATRYEVADNIRAFLEYKAREQK